MKPLDVVAGIIVNSANEVLLAQRPPGKHLAGFWEFPGGKVENGESHEQALQRELFEELHLKVKIVKHLGNFPHVYDSGALTLSTFVVEPLNEPRASADVQVFRWQPINQVNPRDLASADLEPWRVFLSQARR